MLISVDLALLLAGAGLPPAQLHQVLVAIAAGSWTAAAGLYGSVNARRQGYRAGYLARVADEWQPRGCDATAPVSFC